MVKVVFLCGGVVVLHVRLSWIGSEASDQQAVYNFHLSSPSRLAKVSLLSKARGDNESSWLSRYKLI